MNSSIQTVTPHVRGTWTVESHGRPMSALLGHGWAAPRSSCVDTVRKAATRNACHLFRCTCSVPRT
eukprot:scaffold1210_cov410-Prasinococcus_capsulatus_cf.AAC.7